MVASTFKIWIFENDNRCASFVWKYAPRPVICTQIYRTYKKFIFWNQGEQWNRSTFFVRWIDNECIVIWLHHESWSYHYYLLNFQYSDLRFQFSRVVGSIGMLSRWKYHVRLGQNKRSVSNPFNAHRVCSRFITEIFT